ncbi:hypothetical protein AAFP35_15715 [Gordonia sp. CPCC 206044]|uniref:hypothetical protein n=1 Tax=Gordonia sp. CPCC 206044 TaxID=3140793 RepID=UPI003AF35B93
MANEPDHPDDTPSRPISVSELLARSRESGDSTYSPSREGRGRRRVGREGSVSVSELTGEIPKIGDEAPESDSPPSGRAARRAETGPFPRSENPVARRRADDAAVADRPSVPNAVGADRPADPAPAPTRSFDRPFTEPTAPAAPATRDFSAEAVAQRFGSQRTDRDDENANAVTGIIPIVETERDDVHVAEHDDLDGGELFDTETEVVDTDPARSGFDEPVDDFDAYRAFADVEEDEEPKQRRGLLGRLKRKTVDRSARPAAARAREDEQPAVAPSAPDTSHDDVDLWDEDTSETPGVDETQESAPTLNLGQTFAAPMQPEVDDAPEPDADDAPTVAAPASDVWFGDDTDQDAADEHADHDGVDPSVADPFAAEPSDADHLLSDSDHDDTVVTPPAAGVVATESHDDTGADETGADDKREVSPVLAWLSVIGQAVAGLAVGVGLFWGFTELWKWNVYFALVLAVLVIFGIVTFAHLVRRTKDLTTTLLALGVGLIVTIGPLVLLAT